MSKQLWSLRQNMGPSARTSPAMAYDSVRKRTVLFGGQVPGGEVLGDTWEWDGNYWVQVAEWGPSPRLGHGMAFDEARQQVLMFGGADGAGQLYADTWEWDGQYWVQLADTGPSPRSFFGLASDSQRKRVVLFGGSSAGAGMAGMGDTWEWDGNSWNQIQASGPSARSYFPMAYDPGRARTVIFGGPLLPPVADTWEWDGAIWRQVADMGPAPRADEAMIYNGRCLTLFGGRIVNPKGSEPALGDTWEWDGKFWIERLDFGPPSRQDHAMAFDVARGRMVLFGGKKLSSTIPATLIGFGDTWEIIEIQDVPIAPVTGAH